MTTFRTSSAMGAEAAHILAARTTRSLGAEDEPAVVLDEVCNHGHLFCLCFVVVDCEMTGVPPSGSGSRASREEWRQIPAFPLYEASSEGRIRKVATGRILRQGLSSKSYLKVALFSADGTRADKTAHRLVAETFHGPCPEGAVCAHLNGHPRDNRPENLKWCSASENERQKRRLPSSPVRVADLELALDYALAVLGEYEPGDSRAVSNEFVAMAAIRCGAGNPEECRSILGKALEAVQ